MRLIHSVFFCAASHKFSVLVSHIRGTDNFIASSCFQMLRFRQLTPQEDLEPTPLPPSALTLWQVA